MIIWDSGMLHAISKECAMAPSCIIDWLFPLFLLFLTQSLLQAQKLSRLEEMVGKGQEEQEEPGGEVTAGTSGEAVVFSLGNTLFFPLKI